LKNFEKVLLAVGLFGAYILWCALVVQIPKNSFLYALVLAPLVEELVFRYAILKIALRTSRGRRNVYLIAIIVSFIFGAIHWHQNMFLIQGVLGFILSFLYIKTRSYWLIVVFHAGWNAFIHFGLFKLLT